jgi:hypothetical protein
VAVRVRSRSPRVIWRASWRRYPEGAGLRPRGRQPQVWEEISRVTLPSRSGSFRHRAAHLKPVSTCTRTELDTFVWNGVTCGLLVSTPVDSYLSSDNAIGTLSEETVAFRWDHRSRCACSTRD